MAQTLDDIFKESLTSIENLVGVGIGTIVGESDATKSVTDNKDSWFMNTMNGFLSGFTSTSGGQKVVTEAAQTQLNSKFKSFFSSPIFWLSIGGVILFFALKKR